MIAFVCLWLIFLLLWILAISDVMLVSAPVTTAFLALWIIFLLAGIFRFGGPHIGYRVNAPLQSFGFWNIAFILWVVFFVLWTLCSCAIFTVNTSVITVFLVLWIIFLILWFFGWGWTTQRGTGIQHQV